MTVEIDEDILIYVNLELEQQIVKYIATKDSSISLYINPDYFYGSDEKIIFNIIKEKQATFNEKSLQAVVLKDVTDDSYDSIKSTLEELLQAEDIKGYRACNVLIDARKMTVHSIVKAIG